jgi:hypothetical protein
MTLDLVYILEKAWSLVEILETFLGIAEEIRIGEKEGELTIEVELDENDTRVFEEYRYGYNSYFYEC